MGYFDRILQKTIQPRLLGGTILEMGPGRIWPGLSLVRKNPDLDLKGIGYLAPERQEALELAKRWNCRTRVEYTSEPVNKIPLPSKSVDAVISFGALHAWQQPAVIFNEIARVLKVEGEFFIGDVREDAPWWSTLLLPLQPESVRQVYRTRKQSFALEEFQTLLANTQLEQGVVLERGPCVWVMKR